MNKIKNILILLLFLGCQHRKEKVLHSYLTNDSISMWDITMQNHIELSDTSYVHHYFRSISFSIDYTCERFAKTIYNERIIDFLGPKPNYLGLCNKWKTLNDSTIELNCKEAFVVRIVNRDTIHLIDTHGVKQHEMYRIYPPWNIDKSSVKTKDEKIETGEYLNKRIW